MNAPLVSIVTVVRNSAAALARTIACVDAITYPAIEHIIVDGASTDETQTVIAENAPRFARVISEPDFGIYDAINKGVAASTGDFVCLLHAGDEYSPGYIEAAVAEAARDPGCIVYSGHRTAAGVVDADAMSDGVLLHPLGVNHLTFLTPRAVMERVGPYPANSRIVGDHVWTRRAHAMGVPFRRIPGHNLVFAPGGASSATTARQRALVIGENVAAYRADFPFLPENVAEEIYALRFSDAPGDAVADLVETVGADPAPPEGWPRFVGALRAMLRHVWTRRLLDASDRTQETPIGRRLRLARALGLPFAAIGVSADGGDAASISAQIEALADRVTGRRIVLHYLEVFSRPSETYIPDLIERLAAADGDAHVILCDQRMLPRERPAPFIFVFRHTSNVETFSHAVLAHLLDRLAPKQFVFHFATNGWRFMTRAPERWRATPAVYMTHGIDVFDLRRDTPYSRFVRDELAVAPWARFTAVSGYLRNGLVEAGVPAERIVLAHNTVHPRFFSNRASGATKAATRRAVGALRLVNIGRLVPVKGHDTLVRALGVLRRDHGVTATLTIVCGGETELLTSLQACARDAGVEASVTFRNQVDFEVESDFFSGFDLYVSASTYTRDETRRSESFGLALLEAIAAGLPVVTTDAGGQPEVIGSPGRFARTAPHDDPAALASAIADLARSGALDEDNVDYARDRLKRFSPETQIAALREAIGGSQAPRLSAACFSAAVDGGAGGAATRVHRSLLGAGVASRLICRYRPPEGVAPPALTVVEGAPRWMDDDAHPQGAFRQPGHTLFSIDTGGVAPDLLDELVGDADVIVLNWHARFLSFENVARLLASGKPVVFTIRDMHPLTGGCHFFHGCEGWRSDCFPCPQLLPSAVDAPRQALRWKRENWDMRNAAVVVLSEHTRHIVARSALFAGVRIEKIPNPLDLAVFSPTPTLEARAALDLPPDRRIIAYLPSYNSRVKGAAEMERALEALARRLDPAECLLVCAGAGAQGVRSAFETVDLGQIRDGARLALFYSAADVLAAPSLEETFSNTVAEALACATPVVGFDTGAIAELTADGRGAAVPVGDALALSAALETFLVAPDPDIGARCRAHVAETLAPERIGARYRDFLKSLRPTAPSPAQSPRAVDGAARYLAARLAAACGRTGGSAPEALPDAPWPTEPDRPVDLLPSVRLGTQAARAGGGRILLLPGAPGHVVFGPYWRLPAGRYRLVAALGGALGSAPERRRLFGGAPPRPPVLEAAWNVEALLAHDTFTAVAGSGGMRFAILEFTLDAAAAAIPGAGFEIRLWASGAAVGALEALSLTRIDAFDAAGRRDVSSA